MSAAFGVHVGSTSTCLAVYKDGKTVVVANDAGDRVTPAVVAFTDRDQTVGLPAKQGQIRNAKNTICYVKQLLGRTIHDPVVVAAKAKSQVKILDNNGYPAYQVEYKDKLTAYPPNKVSELIFKNLLDIAQNHGAGDIHDAVVTVPVKFNDQQRSTIRSAAQNAGFNVLRLINEPSAATLAYDIGQNNIHDYKNIVVFRVGGISMDVTVVNVNNGFYTILSHTESYQVGGKDFTDALVSHFAADFKRQWKHEVLDNFRAKTKLQNSAELCKHVLSKMPTANISVDSLYEGIEYNASITRARYDSLCSNLVQKCMSPIDDVLKEANLKRSCIDMVILCGGMANTPCLQQALKEYFPTQEFPNKLLPEEVIAIGAAKQASILTGNEMNDENEKETEVMCTSKAIQIQIPDKEDDEPKTVFEALTTLPARCQLQHNTNGPSFCVNVLERPDEHPTKVIGKIVLNNLGETGKVLSVFHLRRDGSLHVSSKEELSNQTADIVIENETSLAVSPK